MFLTSGAFPLRLGFGNIACLHLRALYRALRAVHVYVMNCRGAMGIAARVGARLSHDPRPDREIGTRPRDEPRGAVARHVVPRPLDESQDPVPELHEIHEVNEEPRAPRRVPSDMQEAENGDRAAAALRSTLPPRRSFSWGSPRSEYNAAQVGCRTRASHGSPASRGFSRARGVRGRHGVARGCGRYSRPPRGQSGAANGENEGAPRRGPNVSSARRP